MSGYNIPIDVMDEGERKGLEPWATGGGCDYMVKKLSEDGEVVAVLGSGEDAGSPDSLVDSACVTIYTSGDWSEEWYSIGYDHAHKAIEAMSKMGCQLRDPLTRKYGHLSWFARRHIAACLQVGQRMDIAREGVDEILCGCDSLTDTEVFELIDELVPEHMRKSELEKNKPDAREFRCWWDPDLYDKGGLVEDVYKIDHFCEGNGYDQTQIEDIKNLKVGDVSDFSSPAGVDHMVFRTK